jgi:hypothetical protein
VVAVGAGALGLALAGETVTSALLAGILAEAVFVAGLSILAWPSVVDLARTISAGLRRGEPAAL